MLLKRALSKYQINYKNGGNICLKFFISQEVWAKKCAL
jgi:hypothetical protein